MKQYSLTINGKTYEVRIDSVRDGKADVTVNGTPCRVELPEEAKPAAPAPKARRVRQAPAPAPKREPTAAGAASDVVAPMSGIIKEILVREGQEVTRGQRVAVLEAMKMENEIPAPKDGTITEIHVHKGDSLQEGDPVVTIA